MILSNKKVKEFKLINIKIYVMGLILGSLKTHTIQIDMHVQQMMFEDTISYN